jgi:hypothetical protein
MVQEARMFGFTIRRTSTVRRHVSECRAALLRVEQSFAALGDKPSPELLRRHRSAIEVLHYRLTRAAVAAGFEVVPFTGGLPKPEDAE